MEGVAPPSPSSGGIPFSRRLSGASSRPVGCRRPFCPAGSLFTQRTSSRRSRRTRSCPAPARRPPQRRRTNRARRHRHSSMASSGASCAAKRPIERNSPNAQREPTRKRRCGTLAHLQWRHPRQHRRRPGRREPFENMKRAAVPARSGLAVRAPDESRRRRSRSEMPVCVLCI